MANMDPKVALDGRRGTPAGTLFGIAVVSVCAFTVLGLLALGDPVPFAIGFGLGLLPVPLLLAGVLALDRLEPEPARYLVFAFAWGAGVAIALGILIEVLLATFVLEPLLGRADSKFFTSTAVAPVVEESLKGMVLFGLLWFRRFELNGPTDGIVYAGMVGLGFATMENIVSYAAAADQGGASLATVVVLRGVVTPFSHPAFTSLIGIGVAVAALARGSSRILAPVAGWAAAVTLHALWNTLVLTSVSAFGIAYLVTLAVTIALVLVTVVDRKKIVALIARYLPQYYADGVVTPGDIEVLSDLRARRYARAWAALTCGDRARQAVSDYQRAATELALLHRRQDRGVADPLWSEQRREGLLRLMRAARAQFPNEQDEMVPPWSGSGPPRFRSSAGGGGNPRLSPERLPDPTEPPDPPELPDEPGA